MRFFDGITRVLLLAYPRKARRRYGAEIRETLRLRVQSAHRAGGMIRAILLVLREWAGLSRAGLSLRLGRPRGGFPPGTPAPRTERGRASSGLEGWLYELRIAARGWWRQPGFTAVAALTLALGIGATVAIFSVFHAVVLRPLPFQEPERLVALWETNPERGWDRAQVAAANYLDWKDASNSFADIAAYNDWFDEKVMLEDGEPTIVLANEVTGNFFDVLGVSPLAGGRGFEDADTWSGREPVVVLSHRFWNRRFGGDPAIVGRPIDLDGVASRVLGIMPETFVYPFDDVDLWRPVAWEPGVRQQVHFRRAHGMRVIGRLEDGVALDEAEAELAAIAARLESDYPETNTQMGTGVGPLHAWIVGESKRPLQVLMASVGFLLLIACANVSGMLLARSSGKQDELRIRSALGGGRRRLLMAGLAESMLLAGLGGGLGLIIGVLSIRPLLSMSPEGLPRLHEVGLNGAVVLFALGVTCVAGLIFGSLPAWRGAAIESRRGLSEASRGGTPARRSRRAGAILVAAEIALALPLVVAAGLMIRTLNHLSHVEPGFDPEGVLVASIMLPATRYDSDESMSRFYRDFWNETRRGRGVDALGLSSRLPFGNPRWSSDFTTEGWPADRYGVGVRHDEISPGLFQVMGVPILRGRDFELTDDLGSALVVIINEALAERYFPGEDPIGKRICFDRIADANSRWRTIVGIVGNVRREALSLQEEPSFYAPVLQDTSRRVHALIQGEAPSTQLLATLRDRLDALDPTLPLFDVKMLDSEVAASLGRERFLLILLALAAGVALVLATVGTFGVVLHATTRRVREIGIRMALGARAETVVAMVIRGGLVPVLVGIGIGLVAAGLSVRAIAGFLFEVRPLDPLTYAVVVLLLLVAGLTACWLPARWAARVDATTALRAD